MREDISWWRNNANKYPVLLSAHLPTIIITTDASNTGWGGISDGVVTGCSCGQTNCLCIPLCPVLYIKEYLKRTKLKRQSDQFFVKCAKPYNGVSRDTIRRWTKQVLKLSGVDTVRFKAHSTRAAATSLADFRHVPMDTILKFAGWKSYSTFARYYKRPIMGDSESCFCHAVLTTSTG